MRPPAITLLIPTLNRSDFVIRYLRYLTETQFDGRLVIGDSSAAGHLARVRRALEAAPPPFEVVHQPAPGLRHFECLRTLLPLVTTPYVMYICDDDLVVPRTLAVCIEFLERHPDYSAASGAALRFQLRGDGAHGPLAWTAGYALRDLEAPRACDRVAALFREYVVVAYSVSRTPQFLARWAVEPPLADPHFAIELFPCGLLVAQGKFKQLDQLFVARQIHAARHALPDLFEWVAGPQWHADYAVFRDRIAEELVRQDGLTMAAARAVVKQAVWQYLAAGLSWRLAASRAPARRPPPGWWHHPALRGLRALWHAAQARLPGPRHQMTPWALRRPGSRYAEAFRPIARAIASPPMAAPEAPCRQPEAVAVS